MKFVLIALWDKFYGKQNFVFCLKEVKIEESAKQIGELYKCRKGILHRNP